MNGRSAMKGGGGGGSMIIIRLTMTIAEKQKQKKTIMTVITGRALANSTCIREHRTILQIRNIPAIP